MYCFFQINCLRSVSTKIHCKINQSQCRRDTFDHHWVQFFPRCFSSISLFQISGNIGPDLFCEICEELCGGGVGLQDYRCSWLVSWPTGIHKTDCGEMCWRTRKREKFLLIFPPFVFFESKTISWWCQFETYFNTSCLRDDVLMHHTSVPHRKLQILIFDKTTMAFWLLAPTKRRSKCLIPDLTAPLLKSWCCFSTSCRSTLINRFLRF